MSFEADSAVHYPWRMPVHTEIFLAEGVVLAEYPVRTHEDVRSLAPLLLDVFRNRHGELVELVSAEFLESLVFLFVVYHAVNIAFG